MTRDFLHELDDPDPEVRRRAAAMLGRLRDAWAVRLLCARFDLAAPVRAGAAEALGRIAVRAPCSELRALLPELRRRSDPWGVESEAAIQVYREAALRIEEATAGREELQDLPIPAAETSARPDRLPIPAPSGVCGPNLPLTHPIGPAPGSAAAVPLRSPLAGLLAVWQWLRRLRPARRR
jgi:hypothetical protein